MGDDGCDVLRLADIGGVDRLETGLDIRIFPEHRCIDRTWKDRINANAERLALDRCRTRQRHESSFCRGIRCDVRRCLDGVDTRYVHYRTAFHYSKRLARKIERSQ